MGLSWVDGWMRTAGKTCLINTLTPVGVARAQSFPGCALTTVALCPERVRVQHFQLGFRFRSSSRATRGSATEWDFFSERASATVRRERTRWHQYRVEVLLVFFARQQFLPGVQLVSGTNHAGWRLRSQDRHPRQDYRCPASTVHRDSQNRIYGTANNSRPFGHFEFSRGTID
jgi:hypothetical protein